MSLTAPTAEPIPFPRKTRAEELRLQLADELGAAQQPVGETAGAGDAAGAAQHQPFAQPAASEPVGGEP